MSFLDGLNASDLTMKSNHTKLNMSQEKTAPSAMENEKEDDGQIQS